MAIQQKSVERGVHVAIRRHFISVIHTGDVMANQTKTICGGFNIPVRFWADNIRRLISKGGANQQPVGLGFGGDGLDLTPQKPGLDGNVHIKDLPR